MKVIFLDFDGVLNSRNFVRDNFSGGVIIDPSRLELIKFIVDKTNAKIVLTTSWREHWEKEGGNIICEEINNFFADFDLEIFDKTPDLEDRESEIEAWLVQCDEDIESFVVLYDMFLSSDLLKDHFVLTSNLRNGIDEDDALKAIEILNR